jgi:hypothetical protein
MIALLNSDHEDQPLNDSGIQPEEESEKNRVIEYIRDVLATVYECIHHGHNLFAERHNDHVIELTRTTRSNIIRDYMVNRAKELLGENAKVRFHEKNRMLLLIVGDKVALRFKKLLKRRSAPPKSSNIPTNQVLDWRKGTLSIPALNCPSLKCIDVGYAENSIGSGIDKVWAVALGDKPWYFNMSEHMGEIVPTLFTQEELPADSPFSIKPNVKPKDNGKQASGI